MGRLTTHVLDTARGRPGQGIAITVVIVDGEHRRVATEAVTNADGRCDAPLLADEQFEVGTYELEFAVGDYFASGASGSAEPNPFLDRVVIRFGVSHADEHYHVPLLISPYAYSTYRGS